MADREPFDAIVGGLGPPGSSAAKAWAGRGFRVLGMDRARFPRHKPCGDCLSAKIDSLLGEDLRPLVEREGSRSGFFPAANGLTTPKPGRAW